MAITTLDLTKAGSSASQNSINNMVLVASSDPSAVNSVEFTDSVYSFTDYKRLKIFANNITVSADAGLEVYLDFGSGYVTSNYEDVWMYDYGNNTSNNIQSGNSETRGNIMLGPNAIADTAGHSGNYIIDTNDLGSTSNWKYLRSTNFIRNDDGVIKNSVVSGYESTSAVTKIKFQTGSANMTGNIAIYGVKQ